MESEYTEPEAPAEEPTPEAPADEPASEPPTEPADNGEEDTEGEPA